MPEPATDLQPIRFCPCCSADLSQYLIIRPPKKDDRRVVELPDSIYDERKRGDALAVIAARHGVSERTISTRMAAAGLSKRHNTVASRLPTSIKEEYEGGMTVLQLSIAHKADSGAVRSRLLELGTTMRKTSISGLTREAIADILKRDLAMEPHPSIGAIHHITRERVRQICAQHGNPKRRPLLHKMKDRDISIEQRRQAARERMEEVSRRWIAGETAKQIGKTLGKTYGGMTAQIVNWRKRYPALFPLKRPNHWARGQSHINQSA